MTRAVHLADWLGPGSHIGGTCELLRRERRYPFELAVVAFVETPLVPSFNGHSQR